MEVKVRTLIGQMIDTFEEYIKTKGTLETNYPLEVYMQIALDYISELEERNEKYEKVFDKLYIYLHSSYLINTKDLKDMLDEVKYES